MHQIMRTLEEHSDELIDELTDGIGLTQTEAVLFLREAGPALIASYVWQSSILPPSGLATEHGARELLSGISGRDLAPRVGLSSARTWDGLRALVPAVLRAGSDEPTRPGD
jgi:hypothetical protein